MQKLSFVLILVLASCASSQVPQTIRETPKESVSVSQVQQEPNRFLGRRMRWGGTIIAVHNRQRTTEIEILSRPLDSTGRPKEDLPGQGRFIALLDGFADRVEYPEKRLLTVSGRLVRTETRPVGEYPYDYPVVAVENRYLWQEIPPPRPSYYYPEPWLYPWYRPWYPWHYPWYY